MLRMKTSKASTDDEVYHAEQILSQLKLRLIDIICPNFKGNIVEGVLESLKRNKIIGGLYKSIIYTEQTPEGECVGQFPDWRKAIKIAKIARGNNRNISYKVVIEMRTKEAREFRRCKGCEDDDYGSAPLMELIVGIDDWD